ncbi:hypothetical protein NDU88_011747 [Pleurodeles waltl]|uniref:Uncharacterized protein n=1 Tax=Pleurodeles waltl TaxID=8319 RepID=A0AAV7S4L6_PLEWA|nr:hypothetical protein NDU88_011747 [Pleurodeles waltl]
MFFKGAASRPFQTGPIGEGAWLLPLHGPGRVVAEAREGPISQKPLRSARALGTIRHSPAAAQGGAGAQEGNGGAPEPQWRALFM